MCQLLRRFLHGHSRLSLRRSPRRHFLAEEPWHPSVLCKLCAVGCPPQAPSPLQPSRSQRHQQPGGSPGSQRESVPHCFHMCNSFGSQVSSVALTPNEMVEQRREVKKEGGCSLRCVYSSAAVCRDLQSPREKLCVPANHERLQPNMTALRLPESSRLQDESLPSP